MKLTMEKIIGILEIEINEREKNAPETYPPGIMKISDYRQGFINGLKRAQFLLNFQEKIMPGDEKTYDQTETP